MSEFLLIRFMTELPALQYRDFIDQTRSETLQLIGKTLCSSEKASVDYRAGLPLAKTFRLVELETSFSYSEHC